MQDYDKNPLLKQAISGYVSHISYVIKKQQLERMLSEMVLVRLQQQIFVFSKLGLLFSKPAIKAVVGDLLGHDFVQDLVLLISQSPVTIEERLKLLFEAQGVDMSFLAKHGISVFEFARFVVDLVDHLASKQDEMPQTLGAQKAFITQEAEMLIRTRYVRFERIICYIPVFVEQVGGYHELCSLAVEVKRVIAYESTVSVSVDASNMQLALPEQTQSCMRHVQNDNYEAWEFVQRTVDLPLDV